MDGIFESVYIVLDAVLEVSSLFTRTGRAVREE